MKTLEQVASITDLLTLEEEAVTLKLDIEVDSTEKEEEVAAPLDIIKAGTKSTLTMMILQTMQIHAKMTARMIEN